MISLAGLAGAAGGCGGEADVNVAMSVRYASDGRLVVFAGSAIDAYGPDLVRKTHVPFSPLTPGAPYSRLFAMADDGSVAAIASLLSGDRVQLFDLSIGLPAAEVNAGQSPTGDYSYAPQGLALSPAGDLLFVTAGVGGQVDMSGMFDVSTGALLWTIEGSYGLSAFFSADESSVYLSGSDRSYGNALRKMDSRTGAMGFDVQANANVFGGTSDSNTLVGLGGTSCPGSYDECWTLDLLSTTDGSVLHQGSLATNVNFAGNVGNNGPAFRCASAGASCVMPVVEYDPNTHAFMGGAVQVWGLDGTLIQSIDQAGGDVAISPDGQYVASIYDGDVIVYRVSDGSQVKFLPYRNQTP